MEKIINDATQSTYTIDHAQTTDAGAYYVVVSNSEWDVPSNEAILVINDIERPGISLTVFGSTATVSFTPAFPGNYQIEYSDQLSETGLWQSFPLFGGLVTFPITSPSRFFRIHDLTSGVFSSNCVGYIKRTAI